MTKYLLAVQCPHCDWWPAITTTRRMIELVRDVPPSDVLDNVEKCANPKCRKPYPIPARAYQQAKAS